MDKAGSSDVDTTDASGRQQSEGKRSKQSHASLGPGRKVLSAFGHTHRGGSPAASHPSSSSFGDRETREKRKDASASGSQGMSE